MSADLPASDPSQPLLRHRRCLDLVRRMGGERDAEVLSALVMREVTDLLGAERSTLFLFDWETMELRASVAEGLAGRSLVVPLRMGIVGTAILRRQVTNLTNAYAHPYFNAEIDSALGYKTDSLLVVPMLAEDGRVLGGVELLNKKSGRFDADDERAAAATAERLARWIIEERAYPAGIEAEMVSLRNGARCDRGTVFRLDAATTRLTALYADGGDGRPLSLNLKLGIAGMVAVTGECHRLDDVHNDPRFDGSVDLRTGYRTRTMLCAPMKNAAAEAIGVIQVINKHEGVFDDEDRELLEAIAGMAAIAVENARLFAEQQQQFLGIVDALAASIDAKDPLTAGHSDRSVARALAIGATLGLPGDDLDVLRVAAALHDYGMIGVDDRLLRKAGGLDAEEMAHVRHHAQLTEGILGRIRLARKYRKVPLIAAAHHEAIDGSGYPRGLKGNEIPFLARVIAVADSYEALLAQRPYREAMSSAEALRIIEAGSGTRYDPIIVDALKRGLAAESQAMDKT